MYFIARKYSQSPSLGAVLWVFDIQKGMPEFEGNSVSTFQGARYGKDSQYTPRKLTMPVSFLMERPAHLALGFRGEDLFMSGKPGVRDSLLWPVIQT